MNNVIETVSIDRTPETQLPTGESCVLIIFGASGDLARRKLIPALYDLACMGCMNPKFDVLGIGRTPMSSEDFRVRMHEGAAGSKDTRGFDETAVGRLRETAGLISQGDPNDRNFYPCLKDAIPGTDPRRRRQALNHLFYISHAGFRGRSDYRRSQIGRTQSEREWVDADRFGEARLAATLSTARELNETVLRSFAERDVYRIDHYLGKGNRAEHAGIPFRQLPVRAGVESQLHRVCRDYGGGNGGCRSSCRVLRGQETGALRDMVANHLLQLLAITAMEPPIAFDADSVRGQKVQAFRSIRPMSADEIGRRTVRGQYGPGEISGQPVAGYRKEPGVRPDSSTETFVAIEFHIDNWRWAGVPFYVRTGKRLARQLTEVRVHFKRTPQALFSRTPDDDIEPNMVVINIQPNEGIVLQFGAKRPGGHMQVVPVQANFCYNTAFDGSLHRSPMRRCCSTQCGAIQRCLRGGTRLRRNGASSLRSKKPGSKCRWNSPTTPRAVKDPSRPTH